MKKSTAFIILLLGILGVMLPTASWAIQKKIPVKLPQNQTVSIDPNQLQQMADNLKRFRNQAPRIQGTYRPAYQAVPLAVLNQTLSLNLQSCTISPRPEDHRLVYNPRNSTVLFFNRAASTGVITKKKQSMTAMQKTGLDFLTKNREMFKLNDPQDEVRLTDAIQDEAMTSHLVYQQYYKGIPIWGKGLTLHLDQAGEVYACNGRYIPTPSDMSFLQEKISSYQAVTIGLNDLRLTTIIADLEPTQQKLLAYVEPQAKAYIWAENPLQTPRYIWQIEIRPNIVERWFYFIDRETGQIVEKYNATMQDGPATAQGTDGNGQTQTIHSYLYQGLYYILDASRPMWSAQQTDLLNDPKGGIMSLDVRNTDIDSTTFYYITSSANTWTDPVAVSAHSYIGKAYQYYYDTHQRNSIDDAKMTLISVIHVTNGGNSYPNAYWNGKFMVFGDGGDYFRPLAYGLDVVVHELTHGVVTFTVDLEYKFQSGALNEAFADWGGVMVDREDWLMGEDVVKQPAFPIGIPMRDMSDPHNQGTPSDDYWLPAHMSEFKTMTLDDDNGGVHINVGIINKATYLIGNSLGKDKLEKIYYRVLNSRYLTKQAEFVDMRLGCVQAATDLYGAASTEVTAVKSAFDQVGITGEDPTQPNPDEPPVSGQDWIAFVNFQGNGSTPLYQAKAQISDINQDVKLITNTNIYTGSGCSITISDDGSIIYFIDQTNQFRGIYTDGTGEQIIDSFGIWSSIALSPDGKKLAATTTYREPVIYLFDLEQGTSKPIQLYIPTTSHEAYQSKPHFADALDWNITSNLIVYDTYVSRKLASGDSLYYWDINLLEPNSGIITRPFPPMNEGISLGNPNFSQTSEYIFAFDMFVENYNQTGNPANFIMAANLYSGETGQIFGQNSNETFYPCYSTDDKTLIFHYPNTAQARYELYKVALADNKLTNNGDAIGYLPYCIFPKWFAIGTRPSSILESSVSLNTTSISYNYPNPFNPTTTIVYQLKTSAKVTLEIYDLAGRRIRIIRKADLPAGQYQSIWDGKDQDGLPLGSGVYLYRIQTLDLAGNRVTENQKIVLLK